MSHPLEILTDLAFWLGCFMLFRLMLHYVMYLAIQWADNKRSILYGKTKRERLDFYYKLYRSQISIDNVEKLSALHAEECCKEFDRLKKLDEKILASLRILNQIVSVGTAAYDTFKNPTPQNDKTS